MSESVTVRRFTCSACAAVWWFAREHRNQHFCPSCGIAAVPFVEDTGMRAVAHIAAMWRAREH